MPIKAILFDLDDTLIDWSGFKGSWWELEPRHLSHVYHYIQANVHALDVSSEVFVEEFSRRSRDNWELARDSLISPHLGKLLVEPAQAVGAPADRLDHDRFLTNTAGACRRGACLQRSPNRAGKAASYGLELGSSLIVRADVPARY